MSEQILGPPKGYCDLLDEQLVSKDADDSFAYYPLRPSSAGKCTRELAYSLAEFEGKASYPKEAMDPDTQRLLNLGHSIEYNILKMFEKCKDFQIKYKQQVLSFFTVPSGKLIEGSIDAVFYSEEHKAVIDIKSKGNKYSSWAKTQWDEHNEKFASLSSVTKVSDSFFWIKDLKEFIHEVNDPFLASNFYQLNLYANSEFLKQRGVDHASIIQYNKNDSRIRELRFKPCVDTFSAVQNKFQLVDYLVNVEGDATLAPKDYALGSIKCAFCDYKKACWPTDDSLKAYFATWPKKQWPEKSDLELEAAYFDYKNAATQADKQTQFEQALVKLLNDKMIEKVKFQDGAVYEIKFLKSPRPHMALRRTKI